MNSSIRPMRAASVRLAVAMAVIATVAPAWPAGAQDRLGAADPATVERSIRATRWTISSPTLGEERTVGVVLPESFTRTTRPYPLVFVFDGEAILLEVAEAARALAAAGHMPEVVVVGVENTDRLRDLSPPGIPVSGNEGSGRADVFVRFLKDELQPTLAERFRASGPLWLVGHSSGGLFVHWALDPGWTSGALALDAPVHLGDGAVLERLRALAPADGAPGGSATREPVRLVSMEARFGWSDEGWSELVDVAPDDWLLQRERLTSETHNSLVAPGSYRGLQALFRSYATVGERMLSPAERLARLDERIRSGRVGGPPGGSDALPPPAGLLREVVVDRLGALELASARAALDRLERGYGADATSAGLRAQLASADPDALEGPTLAELHATPFARPGEVGPVIGEWRGTTWTEGRGEESALGLVVRVEDGAVRADITVGNTAPRAAEYMIVDGSTVHVGYMNGMHPRGMLLYEGTVDGDVYEGRFELRGVTFRLPDGSPLPVMRFRLERVAR